MTNAENDRTIGSPPDPAAPRRSRRRQAAIGAAGLAAVLTVGAVAVQLGDDGTREAGSLADAARDAATSAVPQTPAASAVSAAAASSAPARPAASKQAATPAAPTSTTPRTAAERVAAAREAGKRNGVPVQRPVPQATAAAADIAVTDSGSLQKDKRTLRVVSARGDLTGQRELAWVTDDAETVGSARCTQTVRLADQAKPVRKPNLLICWRTSAAKSVYTVAVDLDGDPSEKASVAALEAQWRKLG